VTGTGEATATKALIETRGVEKVYTSRRDETAVALHDVNLSIREGEFVSVVGPSGCGKSTLLKVLGGLLSSTRGEVRVGGEPLRGPRRDVGVVFQSAVLLPWKTVLENVLLPVRVHKLEVARYEQRALRLLAMVGLDGQEHRYPHELSGGMQQRTSVVRALVTDPAILLMDEPFGALDAMTREQLNVDLQRLWLDARKTVVFVTHSISEAVYLGERVVVMATAPGRIVDVVEIDLPRPRPLEVMNTEAFGAYVSRIRDQLGARAVDE
jgi:NitT/TauT family transport system ATP-binding protein